MFITEVTLVDEATGSRDLLRFVMRDVDAVYAHAEELRDIDVPAYVRLGDDVPLPDGLTTPIAFRGWVRLDAVEGWDLDLEDEECADLEAEARDLDDDGTLILLRAVAEESRRAWLAYLRDEPDTLLKVAYAASQRRCNQLAKVAMEARDALAEAMSEGMPTGSDEIELRFTRASTALHRAEDERDALGAAVVQHHQE